ncbi:hypothetical protein ABZ896_11440 [Streptomyces sp. NPDC047072]|uniref:hypothetical protein n=1 Tax=Streptomyces sp. NPDC047072 TaxID=3154809 RepID=UPI0033DF9A6A
MIGSFADAVIVGSASIRALDAHPGPAGIAQAGLLAPHLAAALKHPLPSAA